MNEPSKLLITGASGFIGNELFKQLSNNGFQVNGTARQFCGDSIVAMPLDTKDWSPVLDDVETVIHCAALAHIPQSDNGEFVSQVREYNVAAPQRLAKQAKEKGVKRFIFLSSVKALGESTILGSSYRNISDCSPEDLYGESKHDAELALKKELAGSDTELVIIRPPLVYGPGVKGNFRALMGLAKRNLPLPFGAVKNKRSLVSLENLVSLIIACVKYPEPLNETFLVSDDQDVSTKELFETLTRAYGEKPKLWRCPVGLMRFGATILGKKAIADRLFGNLQLDITHTKKALNWEPPVSFQQAIQTCVNHELHNSNKPDNQ
ncbi:NAD-dependent epimerase/dehydratase family protein [Idiomarina sp. PL1-037]|uniref:NAD-dependent epimerase/dehydratase family protein n=1 Tax=Idiomarina sp. PL1-037 TaxID=3095365 RepID=UPI002ACBE978|nr:NAD-dependent epimerase/dehydratase family protein [Idiomarina sp. PL1-037]WQC53505.1 NAD-dependent epimerase/dehydratase family protein [Idiomarina sp. PL1-037]